MGRNRKTGETEKTGKNRVKNWLIRLLKVLVKPTSWLNGKNREKSENWEKPEKPEKPGRPETREIGKSSQSYKVFDVFFRFNAIYTNIAKKPIVID